MDQTRSAVDRCRAEIRAYQLEYSALSPELREQIRDFHYMGLSDWMMEEVLILRESALQ
jgi:hypothetical protein